MISLIQNKMTNDKIIYLYENKLGEKTINYLCGNLRYKSNNGLFTIKEIKNYTTKFGDVSKREYSKKINNKYPNVNSIVFNEEYIEVCNHDELLFIINFNGMDVRFNSFDDRDERLICLNQPKLAEFIIKLREDILNFDFYFKDIIHRIEIILNHHKILVEELNYVKK